MSAEGGEGLYTIHKEFAATEFGQVLANQVRYDPYRPETVSHERWEKLLGADVNNLKHLPLTYGLTRVFINHLGDGPEETLTPHEEDVLKTSALIHDWAESVVGDINYNLKTDADTEEEKKQFTAHLKKFYDGDRQELVEESLETVIFSEDSKLGRMFNIVERLGYLRTGLRASELAFRDDIPDCREHMRLLASEVLGTQMAKCLQLTELYTPMDKYITNQQAVIDRAFKAVVAEPEVFLIIPEDRRDMRQEQFDKAHTAWLARQPLDSYV